MDIVAAICLRAAALPLPWPFVSHVAGYKYKITNKRDDAIYATRRCCAMRPRHATTMNTTTVLAPSNMWQCYATAQCHRKSQRVNPEICATCLAKETIANEEQPGDWCDMCRRERPLAKG